MSIVYNGAHSITFRKYTNFVPAEYYDANTWTYFHMVPAARPYVVSPEPRIEFVNIPRSNRILDVTNALTNNVTFNSCEGDWEFIIDHSWWINTEYIVDRSKDWKVAYDAISDFFDGSWFDVWLNDQLNYKYSGRVYAYNYRPGEDYSRVSIHYSFDANLYDIEEPYDGHAPTPPGPTPQPQWHDDVSTIVSLMNSVIIDGNSRMISSPIYFTYNNQITKYRITLFYRDQVPIGTQRFYIVKNISGSYSDERLLINEYSGTDRIITTIPSSYFTDAGGSVYLTGHGNFKNINFIMEYST